MKRHVEDGEATDRQRSSGIQDSRPPVPDNQFLRQLPHRLVFSARRFRHPARYHFFLPRPAQLWRHSPVRWQDGHISNAPADRNRKLLWNICLLHSSLRHSYSSVMCCRTMLLRHSRHHQRVRMTPAEHRPLALHSCQIHVAEVDHVTNRQLWIAWGAVEVNFRRFRERTVI